MEEINKKIQAEVDKIAFEQLKNREILKVDKDGKVEIDFNNPKHVEIYERWIED